ncbi:MAG TPA: hypothetical protein VK508_06025 [Cyclobacteriaceae bacterium]|nr:hypothetical protein [Cyclobacteriaceae bacterium]
MAKRKTPSDEQGKDNENDNVNDDSFGLPDLEYKPLESTQETTSTTEKEEEKVSEPVAERPSYTETKKETNYTSSYSAYMEEENKSRTPVIIGVVVALAVVIFGALFYFYVYKPQQAEKERITKEAADLRAKEEQALRDKQALEEAARQRVADSLAAIPATPKEGTIETLTDRTRRYYVVVTSAVDGDLVMDYAKKLSAKGVSTKIIPPFGKYKFSRLAIGDFDTFANAQASADAAKGDYGGAVWVLKF